MRRSAICFYCTMLPSVMLLGCDGNGQADNETHGAARAAHYTVGKQSEENGDLHEAEKHYGKAIEAAEQDGYVSEGVYEDRHRVREKIKQKYGE